MIRTVTIEVQYATRDSRGSREVAPPIVAAVREALRSVDVVAALLQAEVTPHSRQIYAGWNVDDIMSLDEMRAQLDVWLRGGLGDLAPRSLISVAAASWGGMFLDPATAAHISARHLSACGIRADAFTVFRAPPMIHRALIARDGAAA